MKKDNSLVSEKFKFFYVREVKLSDSAKQSSSTKNSKFEYSEKDFEFSYKQGVYKPNEIITLVSHKAADNGAYAFQEKSGGTIYLLGKRIYPTEIAKDFSYEPQKVKEFLADPDSQMAVFVGSCALIVVSKADYKLIAD